MTIDKDVAMKLWRDVYGDKRFAIDCFGTWMCRDAYSSEPVIMQDHLGSSKRYDYSWNVDHIRPKASFRNESDADEWNNLEPMHRLNNLEKSDNHPHFRINNKQYCIIKDSVGGYGIVDSNNNRVDWKKDGRHYR